MQFSLSNVSDGPIAEFDASFSWSPSVHVAPTVIDSFESAPDDDVGRRDGKTKLYSSNFADGKSAEERFEAAATRQGWTRVSTSVFDDRVRRIDCVFQIKDKFLLVDVKGAKRLRRSDPSPQYRYHWIELHSTGSLFSGESTMMALEVGPGAFALFDKKQLRAWILPRLEGRDPVANASQALMRPYQRLGKLKEWITMIDLNELKDLCAGVI